MLTGDLGKYLGVPLQHRRISKGFFSHVTEKIMKKLSAWKANSLSLAGRFTLCSSVINAMPVHMMQTSYLPNVVCSKLDSLNRKFLWGAIDKRKVHLCKWDHVCQPKFSGRLGLRHASCSNLAFMAKIGWGLINNSDDFVGSCSS